MRKLLLASALAAFVYMTFADPYNLPAALIAWVAVIII